MESVCPDCFVTLQPEERAEHMYNHIVEVCPNCGQRVESRNMGQHLEQRCIVKPKGFFQSIQLYPIVGPVSNKAHVSEAERINPTIRTLLHLQSQDNIDAPATAAHSHYTVMSSMQTPSGKKLLRHKPQHNSDGQLPLPAWQRLTPLRISPESSPRTQMLAAQTGAASITRPRSFSDLTAIRGPAGRRVQQIPAIVIEPYTQSAPQTYRERIPPVTRSAESSRATSPVRSPPTLAPKVSPRSPRSPRQPQPQQQLPQQQQQQKKAPEASYAMLPVFHQMQFELATRLAQIEQAAARTHRKVERTLEKIIIESQPD